MSDTPTPARRPGSRGPLRRQSPGRVMVSVPAELAPVIRDLVKVWREQPGQRQSSRPARPATDPPIAA